MFRHGAVRENEISEIWLIRFPFKSLVGHVGAPRHEGVEEFDMKLWIVQFLTKNTMVPISILNSTIFDKVAFFGLNLEFSRYFTRRDNNAFGQENVISEREGMKIKLFQNLSNWWSRVVPPCSPSKIGQVIFSCKMTPSSQISFSRPKPKSSPHRISWKI